MLETTRIATIPRARRLGRQSAMLKAGTLVKEPERYWSIGYVGKPDMAGNALTRLALISNRRLRPFRRRGEHPKNVSGGPVTAQCLDWSPGLLPFCQMVGISMSGCTISVPV